MAKAIGPNFIQEIKAAGISGDGWSWSADGTLNTDALSPATQAAIQAVYDAHNPATPFAYTSTEKDTKSAGDFDTSLLLRAIVTSIVQQLNVLGQNPTTVQPTITAAAVRTSILNNYKALL